MTDLILMLPAFLLIMLETRQSSGDDCSWQLMIWLLSYFGTMLIFCFVRLIRIPVL